MVKPQRSKEAVLSHYYDILFEEGTPSPRVDLTKTRVGEGSPENRQRPLYKSTILILSSKMIVDHPTPVPTTICKTL